MKTKAFSLVELSIVLVILGLLTGGILGGQSLIRAAELRTVSSEHQRYVAAIQTFRDKYFAIPGDMANAQSFWGVAHATPATCKTTASTSPLTCNGDGNGWVLTSAAGSNEVFRFWQHLANAGLIEGTYSGVRDGTTDAAATSTNSPRSRMPNALWFTDYRGTVSGWVDVFNGNYNHIMVVGGLSPTTIPYGPIFKPEELWNLDTKMDDGRPAQGKLVMIGNGTVTNCTDGADSSAVNANYRLNSSSNACAAVFRDAY